MDLLKNLNCQLEKCAQILSESDHVDIYQSQKEMNESLQSFLSTAKQLELFFINLEFQNKYFSCKSPEQRLRSQIDELRTKLQSKQALVGSIKARIEQWKSKFIALQERQRQVLCHPNFLEDESNMIDFGEYSLNKYRPSLKEEEGSSSLFDEDMDEEDV